MRRLGRVYFNDVVAVTIEQADGVYRFQYDQSYLHDSKNKAISVTLPLQAEAFTDKNMIPFFDGLIPEGWLLNIAVTNWKLDQRDRMSLLLTLCNDCIGAVKVIDISEQASA